jgi:hypothetical protein
MALVRRMGRAGVVAAGPARGRRHLPPAKTGTIIIMRYAPELVFAIMERRCESGCEPGCCWSWRAGMVAMAQSPDPAPLPGQGRSGDRQATGPSQRGECARHRVIKRARRNSRCIKDPAATPAQPVTPIAAFPRRVLWRRSSRHDAYDSRGGNHLAGVFGQAEPE